jgi:hypothetical protein
MPQLTAKFLKERSFSVGCNRVKSRQAVNYSLIHRHFTQQLTVPITNPIEVFHYLIIDLTS